MTEITIKISDDLLNWVEIQATESGCSAAECTTDALEKLRAGEQAYDRAMARYFSRVPSELNWIDGRRPTREELHDRERFR